MNLDSFLNDDLYTTEINQETRNRIRLSVYAYAYEFDQSIVDDATFDSLAYSINKQLTTRRPDLDKFFLNEFSPDTGMWIHKHPELDKIKEIYLKYYKRS